MERTLTIVTAYQRNSTRSIEKRFQLPFIPAVGTTMHFDDRAWKVISVSMAPSETMAIQESTPDYWATWHAEIYVSES